MLRIVLLALVCTAFSYEASKAGFEQWSLDYKKVYNPSEHSHRFLIWLANHKTVSEINAEKGSWTAALNSFGDLTNEEFERKVLMRKVPTSKFPLKEGATILQASGKVKDETEFDWQSMGAVTPVKDQGFVGTCWAFSTAANIEGQHFLKTNNSLSLSEEFFVDCDGTADYDGGHADCSIFGGWPYLAYQYAISRGGVPAESDYPYCAGTGDCYPCMNGPVDLCGPPPYYCDREEMDVKCKTAEIKVPVSDWKNIGSDEKELTSILMETGPLSALLDASQLQYYKSGVWTGSKKGATKVGGCGKSYLNHAVLMVGFGVDEETGLEYWRIKNSWAESWGEDGYFRILRNTGECGINTALTTSII